MQSVPDFDDQARAFGGRAGLPEVQRQRIAKAVLEFGGGSAPARVLDLGAGTGEIGLELCDLAISYTGIDISAGMLAVFRDRAEGRPHRPELVHADACAAWPVPAGSMSLVFGSRSLHWIPPSHLITEASRVAAPGGAGLVIGRVVREETDPRERIRREMRRLLRAAGYEGRSGGGRSRETLAECERRGLRVLPARVVAEWTTARRPAASVADWRQKAGLAGIAVPEAVKAKVLEDVARFTAAEFGNIDAPVSVTERYVLEGAELLPFPA